MKGGDLDRVLKLVNGNGLVLLVNIGVKAADAQVEAEYSPIAGLTGEGESRDSHPVRRGPGGEFPPAYLTVPVFPKSLPFSKLSIQAKINLPISSIPSFSR
jgi:hypothetical protein